MEKKDERKGQGEKNTGNRVAVPANVGEDDGRYMVLNGLIGPEGKSAYVYIAYADDDHGTGFTNTFDPTKDYIAILSTDKEIAEPVAQDFLGLWKNYKGRKGDKGDRGDAGEKGEKGDKGDPGDLTIEGLTEYLQKNSSEELIRGGLPDNELISAIGNAMLYRFITLFCKVISKQEDFGTGTMDAVFEALGKDYRKSPQLLFVDAETFFNLCIDFVSLIISTTGEPEKILQGYKKMNAEDKIKVIKEFLKR
jgi:hypothetical protein